MVYFFPSPLWSCPLSFPNKPSPLSFTHMSSPIVHDNWRFNFPAQFILAFCPMAEIIPHWKSTFSPYILPYPSKVPYISQEITSTLQVVTPEAGGTVRPRKQKPTVESESQRLNRRRVLIERREEETRTRRQTDTGRQTACSSRHPWRQRSWSCSWAGFRWEGRKRRREMPVGVRRGTVEWFVGD